jgi:hypothetical protein
VTFAITNPDADVASRTLRVHLVHGDALYIGNANVKVRRPYMQAPWRGWIMFPGDVNAKGSHDGECVRLHSESDVHSLNRPVVAATS